MVINVIPAKIGYDNCIIDSVFMLVLCFKDVTPISPTSDLNSHQTQTDSNSHINAATCSNDLTHSTCPFMDCETVWFKSFRDLAVMMKNAWGKRFNRPIYHLLEDIKNEKWK